MTTIADHLTRIGGSVAQALRDHVEVASPLARVPVDIRDSDHEALGKAIVQALIFAGYTVTAPNGDSFRTGPKAVARCRSCSGSGEVRGLGRCIECGGTGRQ